MKGFLGGATEGAASQLSPANVLSLGKGRLPQLASRILSGAQVLHGGSELAQGNTAEGLGDIGFGILGAHTPEPGKRGMPTPVKEPTIKAEDFGAGFFHKETPKPVAKPGEIFDEAGRSLGFDTTKPRPAGPWDNNVDAATGQIPPKPKPRISAAQARSNMNTGGQLLPKVVSKDAEPVLRKIIDKEPEQAGPIREAWNLARGLMSVDLPFITSAGFRQGLNLIGTKEWVNAWGPSIKAYGSKAAYDSHAALLRADPLMQRTIVPEMKDGKQIFTKGGQPKYKETPSIVEKAGVSLTDLGSLSSREESIRSQLAERIPIWGKVVAASNRSYTAYINDLRLNAFRNMYEAMPNKNDMVALRQIGDAVNTFTGKGPLRTQIPFSGGKEFSIEKHAGGLGEILFAPKLIASRLQMMNPVNYTMTQPQVRKEYVKALLRTAGAWTTFGTLGALAGGQVSTDPKSADFGKIRFGDTRLDPAGGFQQFLVLMARLGTNEFTSSNAPIGAEQKTFELGKGFGAMTRGSVAQDFAANKLHPALKYFYDAAFAKQNRQFGVFDRAVQLAIPMLTGDLISIAQENPELLPVLAPLASAGMGTQHYTQGEPNKPIAIGEEGPFGIPDVVLGR
jgi:hypothetical protein